MTAQQPPRKPVARPPLPTPFNPYKPKPEPINPEFALSAAKTLYAKIQEIDDTLSRLHAQRESFSAQLDKILRGEV